MKKAIALALIAGASIATGTGQILKLTGAAEFTISPGKYGNDIKKIETRFYEQGYEAEARVFKVVSRSMRASGAEGGQDESVIEAYGTKKSSYDTKIWSGKYPGADFKVFNDDLVTTTDFGCCDSPNLNYVINAKTGKAFVTTLNETMTELDVPNSKLEKRYLAQIDETKIPAGKGAKSYIGSIGYFVAGKVKSIARIYAVIPKNWGMDLFDIKPVMNTKDEFHYHTVTVWSADGSKDEKTAFNGLGLSAHMDADKKAYDVSVLIDQDRLSASASKATPDVELEILNF